LPPTIDGEADSNSPCFSLKRLRAEARYQVDRVLQQAGHRGVVFGRADHEGVVDPDAFAEPVGAGRETVRILYVGVVGGGVEVGHRGGVDDPTIGLDCGRRQAGQAAVERVGSQGCREDQEPNLFALLAVGGIRGSHVSSEHDRALSDWFGPWQHS
jgi:hypothetical protein